MLALMRDPQVPIDARLDMAAAAAPFVHARPRPPSRGHLFSRRVVGWSMSAEMTAQLVTDALVMAIWRRGKPDALLHHSDRGSQYTSEQFQKLMAEPSIEELPIEEMWVGHRPGSRDDAPILGRGPVDGLIYATGHHRNWHSARACDG